MFLRARCAAGVCAGLLWASIAFACVPYAPNCTVTWSGTSNGQCTLPVLCPLGDVATTLSLTLVDFEGFPLPDTPANEVIVTASGTCPLYGGSPCGSLAQLSANTPTDANGFTTITVRGAGGCCTTLRATAGGFDVATLSYRSYDANADGRVDLMDLGNLASTFQRAKGSPGYNECFDFSCDDVVSLPDLGYFASHYNHRCP